MVRRTHPTLACYRDKIKLKSLSTNIKNDTKEPMKIHEPSFSYIRGQFFKIKVLSEKKLGGFLSIRSNNVFNSN
jgi:hypothetical protein